MRKLVERHNSKRLLSLSFKGLSENMMSKRLINEKAQRADSFAGFLLYKKAQQCIDVFKANREKAILRKDLFN